MCELCGFKPKTIQIFENHLINKHFSKEFQKYIPESLPSTCPILNCQIICINKEQVQRHLCKILEIEVHINIKFSC